MVNNFLFIIGSFFHLNAGDIFFGKNFQEFIKKIKFILRKLLYNDKLLDILIIAILFHTTGV